MAAEDWSALALTTNRAEFVARHRFLFLAGEGRLRRPAGPRRTASFASFNPSELETTDVQAGPDQGGPRTIEGPPAVLAVRKVQSTFPEMIAVGRTANNDVVVSDVSVSKFHAVFATSGSQVLLSDAGSRNGTWVDGQRLEARGQAMPVGPGSAVRFGNATFRVLDAAELWDVVHET